MSPISANDTKLLSRLFKAHPWHGIGIGERAPELVNSYIEIVPADTVKYEVDKATGHLRVDRPQKYSSQCPALYGFVPQTYCHTRVGRFCSERIGRPGIAGDGDPIDICVLSEKQIPHGEIILRAIPIGGIRMVDRDKADDKIVAVLYQDAVYGTWSDISQCPSTMVNRLRHYFLTYKDLPGEERKVEVTDVYGADEARKIISLSQEDYHESFSEVHDLFLRVSGGADF